MKNSKLKAYAKRSLAVISSLAVLFSCVTAGLFTADAAVIGAAVSAGDDILGPAKTSHIYDEYGNRLTDTDDDTSIVYVDNSMAAGGSTTADVVFEIQNSASDPELDDEMILSNPEGHFGVDNMGVVISDHKKTYTLRIKGTYMGERVSYTDPFTQKDASYFPILPYPAGKYSLILQTKSGEGYRKLSVVVQSPATDMSILYRGNAPLEINEHDMYNTASGLHAVANHQYELTAKLETTFPNAGAEYLDTVEWLVYDGELSGEQLYDDPYGSSYNKGMLLLNKLDELYAHPAATRAEITQDGLLTAKSDGYVTVVARFKDTIKAQKDYERRLRAYNRKGDQSQPVPQYISDRNPVAGFLNRKIYVPELDDNKNIIWENGEIVYKTDNGTRLTAEYNKDYRIRRDHYFLNADGVEYGTPIMLDQNTPQLVPLYMTPKLIIINIAKDNPATEIEITSKPSNNTMIVNESFQLEMSVTPTHNADESGYESGATDEFEWVSSEPDVVTVDSTGLLTAKSKGKSVVTVKGDNVSASITIDVRSPAQSIAIEPESPSVTAGESTTITAVMSPADANEDIVWTSDKPGVAEVTWEDPTENIGNTRTASITGVSAGTAVITAKSKNTGVEKTCIVTVNRANPSASITLTADKGEGVFEIDNNGVIDLYTNQEIEIESALRTSTGNTADDETVWTVEDTDNCVTYEVQNNTLKLHGEKAGTVSVKASSAFDPVIAKEFKVSILKCSDTVTIVTPDTRTPIVSKTIHTGLSFEVSAELKTNDDSLPYEHSDAIKTFESADRTVAEVENITDEHGAVAGCKVSALKDGSTQITAITNSGKTASMDVRVYTASSINITNIMPGEDNTLSDRIDLGDELTGSKKIEAAVTDGNSEVIDGAAMIWSSSEPEVATVDSDGLVTAHDVGTTVITVSTEAKDDAVKKDECTITVCAPLSAVQTSTIEPLVFTPDVTSYKPEPSLKFGEHTLVKDVDYTLEYFNNTGVGNASIKITGTGCYFGEKTVSFTIDPRPLSDSTVTVDTIEEQECTGKEIEPKLNITCLGCKLDPDKDYSCTYKNNIRPGTASITINGKGNYTGSLTRKFEIVCRHNELKDVIVLKDPTYEEDGLEAGTCAACGETNVRRIIPKLRHTDNAATSVQFKENEYGLSQGETMQLEIVAAANDPSSPVTDAFRWESDDPAVVSVDDKGIITANSCGKAVITVYGENDGVEASCTVAVLRKIENITAEPDPINTRVGTAVEAKLVIDPTEYDDDIIWSIDNADIATVTPSGTDRCSAIVTGVSAGETKLTVKGRLSGISKTVAVIVGEKIASDIIAVSTIVGDTSTLIPNSTESAEYTYKAFTDQDIVFDAAITDGTAIWRITGNDGGVVSLPGNDPDKDIAADSISIHTESTGTVTVTAWAKNDPDHKTHFKLEVAKRCDKVVIRNEKGSEFKDGSLSVSDSIQLYADLTADDPSNIYSHGDAVRYWSSSDPETVSIDQSGFVTAKKNGSAEITVTTLSGLTASATINVYTTLSVSFINGVTMPENEDDLPYTDITLNSDLFGTAKIEAAVFDQNNDRVENAVCKWSSSDESVASADESGLITAHRVGTAVITVRTGTKTQKCVVIVTAPVTVFTYDDIQPTVFDPANPVYEPDPVFSVGGSVAAKDIDYTVEYQNNAHAGTGRMIVTGIGSYTDTMTISFLIEARSLSDSAVEIEPVADQDYTGSPIEPTVRVTCNGAALDPETDYYIEYTDNVDPGKASVKVTARGGSSYSDSKTVEFNIVKRVKLILGDLDGDGNVTSADALLILRKSMGFDDEINEALGDIDGDGELTSSDALAVLRWNVKLYDASNEKVGTEVEHEA